MAMKTSTEGPTWVQAREAVVVTVGARAPVYRTTVVRDRGPAGSPRWTSTPRPRLSIRATRARSTSSTHQAERKRWEPLVESGDVVCVRCGFPIVRHALALGS